MSENFDSFSIIEPIRRAIAQIGFKTPTPIQTLVIPLILANKDIIAIAETGTGKTAAFCIPVLQQSYYKPENRRGKRKLKALILAPTREIALQIGEHFDVIGKHTGLQNLVIYGGIKQGKQADVLHNGVDILIATPGRFLDLYKQNLIPVNTLQVLVIDEADRMLNMGFEKEVLEILTKLPPARQSLLFSATMNERVLELSKKVLRKPIIVNGTSEKAIPVSIQQKVYLVEEIGKKDVLLSILRKNDFKKVLIFTPTIFATKEITHFLKSNNHPAAEIHSDKSQNTRQNTLSDFRNNKIKILVGTDIMARGIDVDDIDLVVNFNIPNKPETFIHRIGRTGRAGKIGLAISLCSEKETIYLKGVELLLGEKIEVGE